MLPTGPRGWPLPLLLLPLLTRGAPTPGDPGDPDTAVVVPSRLPGSADGELKCTMTAFGQTFVLNLVPDASFLAPEFKVEFIGGAYGATEGDRPPRGCFYSGTVNGDPQSLAAVSLCHGLHGSFELDGHEYTVRPRHGDGGSVLSQAHLLQRWGPVPVPTAGPPGPAGGRSRQAREVRGDMPERDGDGDAEATSPAPPRRRKRFVSQPRYLETLVVADETVLRFYGAHLQNHILTLMSVAARIFKHPSIKNSINLVLVKMLVIRDGNLGPNSSQDGNLLLKNFCSWQRDYNPPSDRHAEHYDTAVLLTRKSFCLDSQSCDTLGLADIGVICDPRKSCSIVLDQGLQSAYTLAHELGHVLGMLHDDSNSCVSKFGTLSKNHLMASLFKRINRTLPWSICSASFLTDTLDKGKGDCLLDQPTGALVLPTGLPGNNPFYNLDQQCRQLFGPTYVHCSDLQVEPCSKLWCREGPLSYICSSKSADPQWLDGTSCGSNGNICLLGQCLTRVEVEKSRTSVDGSWSSWGSWGACSRTCGGGIQYIHRDCANPAPRNGGEYCVGQRTSYRSCNTQECPDRKTFREVQCEQFNNINYKDSEGNVVQWMPKYAGVSERDRCKLICRIRGRQEYKMFGQVVDGTPCGLDTDSVCVNGQCIQAGCDHVIGSLKTRDHCGVCGGNSSTCQRYTGVFNPTSYGYNHIVTFPAGTTNIDIKQRSYPGFLNDGNYLVLKATDGSYLLNGDLFVMPSEYDVYLNGTTILYSGCMVSLERLQTFEPLPEPLTLQLLTVAGEQPPPAIKFCFSLPNHAEFNRPISVQRTSGAKPQPQNAQWFVGAWHNCSSTCGAGWQMRLVECRLPSGELATTCNEEEKPADLKACKNQCPE
ncbi:A disintegrin and metalloproteinase with thrombospondin motifs 8 [Sorex fumeus]|uniref:A disintegrin and metalloproteinase with thrombospondin motifs 8 n=1 Tax=Sorex fumeus TaxID=62283 RepID=UPI0024ACC4DC|nr:A disintegrin and metalloproteinase with thrombospondin motifs 8 [Sorex fumeus]